MGNGAENKTKQSDAEAGKGMAVLSYLAFLALIPYFTEKNNKFVRYHAIQGMNLLLVWVGWCILGSTISGIAHSIACANPLSCVFGGWGVYGIVSMLTGLVYLGIGVVAIIGIINALQGQEKEVPILGKIKIIKK